MSKFAVIIPARYESSRFPGKPLALISGKPMIIHVAERCSMSSGEVFVATDSEEIALCVEAHGFKVVMTSEGCITGTDRVAEVAKGLQYNRIVSVQGDEPLIAPKDIDRVAKVLDISKVVNCYADNHDGENLSTINLTMQPEDKLSRRRLLYASRGPIPFSKGGPFPIQFRQVCIYGFRSNTLCENYGPECKKTALEEIEDIEILRLLERGVAVDMIKVEPTIAVDWPDDVEAVEKYLAMRENKGARL